MSASGPYPGQNPYPGPYQQSPHQDPYRGGPAAEPPLWAPHYEAPPRAAIVRFFRKYADFSGRAGRAEYWWIYLALTVVVVVVEILAALAGIPGSTVDETGTWQPGPGSYPFLVVLAVLMFGTLVPNLALAVRRLHDVDVSGWFLLLGFVPFVGGIVLFVFSVLPPKPEGARFDRPTGYVGAPAGDGPGHRP